MRTLKNLTAFFCILLVAALGIFLPGALLQSSGRELLGQVRQADVDYHAGEVDFVDDGETSMENKLRLVSGIWNCKREQIWCLESNEKPPSLSELKNKQETDAEAGSREENAGDIWETEAETEIVGDIWETETNREAEIAREKSNDASVRAAADDEAAYFAIETALESAQIVMTDVYGLEMNYDDSASLKLYQYTDAYFGKYRCWCMEYNSTLGIPVYNENGIWIDCMRGGWARLAFDLETGQLLRFQVRWDTSSGYSPNFWEDKGYNPEELFWTIRDYFGLEFMDVSFYEDVAGTAVYRYALGKDGSCELSARAMMTEGGELPYAYDVTEQCQDFFLCLLQETDKP